MIEPGPSFRPPDLRRTFPVATITESLAWRS